MYIHVHVSPFVVSGSGVQILNLGKKHFLKRFFLINKGLYIQKRNTHCSDHFTEWHLVKIQIVHVIEIN